MYKIVDYYNGETEVSSIDSYEEAEEILAQLRKHFRQDNTANTRCYYCIVDNDAEWRWNEMKNHFEWY